ncbi:MAG: (2Fe-2S)-binding protein [Nevskiales bacterium]
MYICLCKAVTENKIRRAVADGACTLRELQYAHGVGTGCGKCVPAAKTCLDEALRAQARQSTLRSVSAVPAA